MYDIILSEKEQKLLDFIKEKGEVTIAQIEIELSKSHTGALGRLLGKELIKSYKKRITDTYNAYGTKYVKCYKIKEEKKDGK